jgi:hypothetical protein
METAPGKDVSAHAGDAEQDPTGPEEHEAQETTREQPAADERNGRSSGMRVLPVYGGQAIGSSCAACAAVWTSSSRRRDGPSTI